MSFPVNLNAAYVMKRNIFNIRKYIICLNRFASSRNATTSKKMADFFFDKKVQNILMKITGMDYDKIFRPKTVKKLSAHKYMFVTDKKLKELQEETTAKAVQKLQMPPVMDVREPINELLAKNPELQGFLDHKIVFTDVSLNVSSRDRIITVRETNGMLRKATWEERFRMNQIFFPLPGRSMEMPKLFESPYLDSLLEDESYEFVLDVACCQFEPDDPEYHKVTSAAYEHINYKKKFDALRSTRHFGPMAFYFAYTKNINSLLVDMIERQLIGDAADTIKLLFILHPEISTSEISEDKDETEIVQEYVENNLLPRNTDLQLTMQTYLEIQSSKNKQEAIN